MLKTQKPIYPNILLLSLGGLGGFAVGTTACVATFLAFLQPNYPALPLSSHFCSQTALRCRVPRIFCSQTVLRCHFPRISAAKLACVGTAPAFLQQNCPALPLSAHLSSKTALRCYCPALPLCCMASELRSNLLRRIMRRGHTSFL